jgi:hypothetical protein
MQILPTNEFLAKKLGLVNGNPFSETQAEEEEQLSKYFVDLPAFYKILDTDTGKIRSSILSASRGCGKSANRRNVERWLRQGPSQGYEGKWPWERPILVISYTDFSRLKNLVNDDFSKIRPEDHVNSILWIGVSSLLEYLQDNWEDKRPKEISPWLLSYLGYFLVNYTTKWALVTYSSPKSFSSNLPIYQTLDSFLDLACSFVPKTNNLFLGGSTALLQGFKDVAFAFGIKNIAILVDGVDELDLTADDPRMGASLVKNLIAERNLMQLDGIYFKFFLPNEVVSELKKMPETRLGERIKYYRMSWEENSIQLLLSERLKAFSNGALQDLGQIASPDVMNVGQLLAVYANNNPRNLLRLCNYLLIELARHDATHKSINKNQKVRITKTIIDEAIASFEKDFIHASSYSPFEGRLNNEDVRILSVNGWEITQDLTVIHRGNVVSQEKLDPKELDVLTYLLENAGQLIRREDLGKAVWKDKWVTKYGWVLNQTILRLRKKIGSNHIETVRGLGYRFHSE